MARGVAIAGTLATNVWIMSHPGGLIGYVNHPTTPDAAVWQQQVERLLMALANGKFLGLLTLMFGIGLMIQAESASRKGRCWPGGYLVRTALLFVEGFLHFLLIAEFDVLMGYAVTAALVAFLVQRSRKVQDAVIAGCLLTHAAAVGLVTWLLVTVPSTGGTPTGPNVYATGTWFDMVVLRIDNMVAFRLEPVFIFCLTTALFLIGARLWRAGLFGAEGRSLRRRLMVAGALALPIDLVSAMTMPDLILVNRYLVAPVVALGLLALMATVVSDGQRWWERRGAEVGRMALTCYISQNLLCTAVFYGWGLGLNTMPGHLRLPVTVAVFIVVCACLATFAHWWLARFSRGPVEWAWHRASERLLQIGRRRELNYAVTNERL